MINRRTLMKFLPSSAALVGLPAIAKASSPNNNENACIFIQRMMKHNICKYDGHEFSIIQKESDLSNFNLSIRMILRHPEFFDPKYQMIAPVSLVGDSKAVVTAMAR